MSGKVLRGSTIEYYTREMLLSALISTGEEQEALFRLARQRRTEFFPLEKVEIRSVIEVSNVCRQRCCYCGMSVLSPLERYTLDNEQILSVVSSLYSIGRRFFFLQSGENVSPKYISAMCACVEAIKKKYKDVTVILCLGNLPANDYARLKSAGAERYVLKFETSNPDLYRRIKPGDTLERRMECLHALIDAGFEVGTGNIIGLPGQTVNDVVDDLLLMTKLKLSMGSSTVFIAGEHSRFHDMPAGSISMTLNFMALMRIVMPHLLIPSTSSLEKASKGGQLQGLLAGANSCTIHDGTPPEVKCSFPIYSDKRFSPNSDHIESIIAKAGLIIG